MSKSITWMHSWEQTSSLLALRELTRAAEAVAPAVANRAGLTHNELRTLEHLMDGPRDRARSGRRSASARRASSASSTGSSSAATPYGSSTRPTSGARS